MDYIGGTCLSTILKQPTRNDQEEEILNPDIDNAKLDKVYDQIASFMLQLSQLDFSRIGVIAKDPASNTWSVNRRPLTYNMNELATVSGYPIDKFPTAPFTSAIEYFQNLANEHLIHLQTQRNLSNDREDAQKRFIARHRFKKLIPKYCIDNANPFKPFCDDLQPLNMLVNEESLKITAVLDIELQISHQLNSHTTRPGGYCCWDRTCGLNAIPRKNSSPYMSLEWSSSCEPWNE
jgi:hypothetical protein